MNNKKGFTLVELLAVIVILALIMGIAVVSIGGVIQGTRQSTFRESAAQIVDGVRTQLVLHNKLEAGTNYYAFASNILEKGGTESPLGGNIKYATSAPDSSTKIGDMLYKLGSAPTCSGSETSYVTVTQNATTKLYSYSICLTAGSGNYYIKNATEDQLLSGNGMTDGTNPWLVK